MLISKAQNKCLAIVGMSNACLFIGQFVQQMLDSSDFSKPVPKLFFEFIEKKFGFNDFISKYYESYLVSIKQHKAKDSRLDLFTQFLGQGKEPLPINIFQIYLNAIDVSGYIVSGNICFLTLEYLA